MFGNIVAPRWANDESLADVRDMIVIFPGIGPVFFIYNASLQVANRLRPEAGKVPEALCYLLAQLFLCTINGEVRVYLDRLPGQHAVLLSFIRQLDWFFDCYAGGVAI